MAVKSSGALSFTDLTTEFGGGNPISLSQFYRGGGRVPNGSAANAGVPTSGTISLSQMYSTIKELIVTVAGNTTNYNFLNAINATYGTVSQAVVCRLVINSGVTIGATDPGQNALVIGDFPDGSILTIDNYGSIQGSGGWGGGYYSAGGQGGTAIYAAYANQTMTINNFGGASIYGGGGGGGSGGWGGQGGTGGGGWYNYWGGEVYVPNLGNPPVSDYAFIYNPQNNITWVRWGGGTVWSGNGQPTQVGDFLRSNYHNYASFSSGGENPTIQEYYLYGIQHLETAYTGGGAGGGGGTGGAGGRGIGYGNGNNAPAGGNGGAPGAGGGTNAGSGGYGGTGGSGGWGGGWGAAGGQGATGNTGATGNAGNNGGGSPGAGGGGGAGGGNPGYYLYRNGAPVTLNNSGGLAGWNG